MAIVVDVVVVVVVVVAVVAAAVGRSEFKNGDASDAGGVLYSECLSQYLAAAPNHAGAPPLYADYHHSHSHNHNHAGHQHQQHIQQQVRFPTTRWQSS